MNKLSEITKVNKFSFIEIAKAAELTYNINLHICENDNGFTFEGIDETKREVVVINSLCNIDESVRNKSKIEFAQMLSLDRNLSDLIQYLG